MTLDEVPASSDLAIAHLTITNGRAQTLTKINTRNYTLTVIPTTLQGEVTCELKDSTLRGSSGSYFISNMGSVTYDITRPTVRFYAPETTRTSPIWFQLVFSEEVRGLTPSDFTVTNGSKLILAYPDPSGTEWKSDNFLYVTPVANGTVTVQLRANAVEDRAGNTNLASSVFSATFDTESPTPTVSSGSASANNPSITFSISFSESVTELTTAGVAITNGTLDSLSGSGAEYSLIVTAASAGEVKCEVLAGAARDAAGNESTASTPAVVLYDIEPPTATVSPLETIWSASSPFRFEITFSEPVAELDVAGIAVTGGTKGDLTGSGTTYSLLVTPTFLGELTCQVLANAANDLAGNPSLESNLARVLYENVAPTTPTSLRARPISSTQVKLTWGESLDPFGAGMDGYLVQRSDDGGATFLDVARTGLSHHLEVGLSPATTYAYRVLAMDIAGNRSGSEIVMATTSRIVDLMEEYEVGAWGTGVFNPEDPFNTSTPANRAQFVLLAEEMKRAGLGAGDEITELRLHCNEVHGRPGLAGFRIRLQHRAENRTSAFVREGWVSVFGPAEVATSQNEWIVFQLMEPFEWNGKDNLLVDLSRSDADSMSGGGMFVRTGDLADRMIAGYGTASGEWPSESFGLVLEAQGTVPKIRFAFNPVARESLETPSIPLSQGGGESGGGGGGGCGLVGLDSILLLAILWLRRRAKKLISIS